MATQDPSITITPVDSPSDFDGIFHCVREAFGRQAQDAVWALMNPNWTTPSGATSGAAKLRARWEKSQTSLTAAGHPTTIFLKAATPDGQIAGMAIWVQASFVPGQGEPPTDDLGADAMAELDPQDRTFAAQMFRSLWRRRIEVAREKAESGAEPPAIFVLDMCAVDPEFQRRGIAGRLVQWGLEEAERRGGLEATTEGSAMGRKVYAKLGFKPEGEGKDIEYVVDEEFKGRDKPPNLFMRTGA